MRFNCEICGKQFAGKPAAMAHHREKHEGRAHIIPGTGRSVLRRQINEAQAEIARLQAELEIALARADAYEEEAGHIWNGVVDSFDNWALVQANRGAVSFECAVRLIAFARDLKRT